MNRQPISRTIQGTSPKGRDREIDCWIEGGQLCLHIHSPGNRNNGWQINLPGNEIQVEGLTNETERKG